MVDTLLVKLAREVNECLPVLISEKENSFALVNFFPRWLEMKQLIKYTINIRAALDLFD